MIDDDILDTMDMGVLAAKFYFLVGCVVEILFHWRKKLSVLRG